MAKYSSDEQVIGTLKASTSDSFVKQLFDAFDCSKPYTWNVDRLSKDAAIKKDHLVSAFQVILGFQEDFPLLVNALRNRRLNTKFLYADAIVSFICGAREIECMKCCCRYSPYEKDNSDPELRCAVCDRPSHAGCYPDYLVDADLGIAFFCSHCHPKLKMLREQVINTVVLDTPSDISEEKSLESDNEGWEVEEVTEADVKNADPLNSTPPANPVNSTDVTNSVPTRPSKPAYDRSKPVCKELLQGCCKHGFSGTQNGNCSEYHPPWCHRFTRNGPGGKRGCRYSDSDCHFWHPTLCQNGLKMKSCLNTDCKLVHIRGTNRSHQTQDQVKGPSKPGTPKPAPNVKANKK